MSDVVKIQNSIDALISVSRDKYDSYSFACGYLSQVLKTLCEHTLDEKERAIVLKDLNRMIDKYGSIAEGS